MSIKRALDTMRLVQLAGGDLAEAMKLYKADIPVETVRARLASRIDATLAAAPHLRHLAGAEPHINGNHAAKSGTEVADGWSAAIDAVNKREP
jgi:hypothetical protein